MLNRFKNLDKKQKLQFYTVLGWSGSSLGGSIIGARNLGIGFTDLIIGWASLIFFDNNNICLKRMAEYPLCKIDFYKLC